MTRRAVALATVALLLAACGGDGGRFDDQAEAVREAVESGDRDAALSALDQIALEGLEAHAAGELSDAEVDELAQLVDQGRALVDEEVPEPTTTTASTTTTTTAPPPPVDDDDDGGDDEGSDGKGKGRKSKGDD